MSRDVSGRSLGMLRVLRGQEPRNPPRARHTASAADGSGSGCPAAEAAMRPRSKNASALRVGAHLNGVCSGGGEVESKVVVRASQPKIE